MNSIFRIALGLMFLLISAGFVFILSGYLFEGAGLQLFGPFFSTATTLLGAVQFMGLIMAAAFAFILGIYWLTMGILREKGRQQ
jgi:hypothetical protein